MSTAQWTLVLTAAGGSLTWATFVARLLWIFRGRWDETNSTLSTLKDRITDLHSRDTAIEQRLERHLEWHDRH